MSSEPSAAIRPSALVCVPIADHDICLAGDVDLEDWHPSPLGPRWAICSRTDRGSIIRSTRMLGMVGERSVTAAAVTREDARLVGEVLGRAFHEDPLWGATFTDAARRPRTLVEMFTALTKSTVAARGVVEVTPGITGAAVWLPPGRDLGLWSMMRSGLALPRFAMGLPAADRGRMMSVLRQLDDRRKVLMPTRHWYLSAVGVDPSHHGEGLGSSLVRSGIAKADGDETPIYLETETETNVDFYLHLGFEIIEQTTAIGLDLPIWLMARSPSG